MQVHIRRVEARVPADGEVRMLCITDKQFGRQRILWEKPQAAAESAEQLEFF